MLGAAAVAGCGIETARDGRSAPVATTPTTPATWATARTRRAPLPVRPRGTIALAGDDDAFPQRLTRGAAAATGVRVIAAVTSEAEGYEELCAGRADAIQTSRPPTGSERDACTVNGLEVADPVPVGADAVVLATGRGAGAGGDCLTLRQARDVFRAGSPYRNWRQLGFSDLPIRTTGREDGSPSFEFFGFAVLGLPDASPADVRADYRAHRTADEVRDDLTSARRLAVAERGVQRYRERRAASTLLERRRAVNRAGLRGGRPAALRADARFDARIDRDVRRYRRRVLEAAVTRGIVGALRFADYERADAALVPLEIDFGSAETASGQPVRFGDLVASDQQRVAAAVARAQGVRPGAIDPAAPLTGVAPGALPLRTRDDRRIFTGRNCVAPSQMTVSSGSYPLTRRVLYVTTRNALRRTEVRRFLTRVLDDAPREARRERLVAITEDQRRGAYITVTGSPPPP